MHQIVVSHMTKVAENTKSGQTRKVMAAMNKSINKSVKNDLLV